jgi:hypothetical protein
MSPMPQLPPSPAKPALADDDDDDATDDAAAA